MSFVRAGTVNGSSIASTADGVPSVQPVGNLRGDGRSRGSPSGEPAHVGELTMSGHRLPRRHVARPDGLPDVVAPGVRIRPRGQRERRDLAGAMAGLAVSL